MILTFAFPQNYFISHTFKRPTPHMHKILNTQADHYTITINTREYPFMKHKFCNTPPQNSDSINILPKQVCWTEVKRKPRIIASASTSSTTILLTVNKIPLSLSSYSSYQDKNLKKTEMPKHYLLLLERSAIIVV